MENTGVVESMDGSEVRSESLGEKRPLENGLDRDLGSKKARVGGEDVVLAGNVKKVAEIVLLLATMGKMRGGRKPTAVEVQMMVEAREKLADVCKEFAPKDIFPRDAFGTVIEDLGLNRLKEQRLGIRPQKMSIAEKLKFTKEKMEKSEVFPLRSNIYTPPRLQSNLSGAAESRGTSNVRMFSSDKANPASVSSGSFQHPSNTVHASAANSRTLPYQLPTSEVRPGVSSVSPSIQMLRAERPQFRLDVGSNGSSYASESQAISAGDHMKGKTPTWSMQPQSGSFAKLGSDKMSANTFVKAEGSSDMATSRVSYQGITSKPFITQVTSSPMTANHMQHRMNFIQSSDTHGEISKIVQKLLQPHLPDHPTWNPPSRDYMSKALTCQMCKGTINEVDTALVCDACERGYHLRCLQCNPKAIPRGEWQEWHCAKCLAISNGKPLPPKYGRVMRNISTPKLSSNALVGQPSLDKKVQSSHVNVNQQMMTTNENFVNISQSASGGTAGTDSKLAEVQANDKNECGIHGSLEQSSVSSSIEGSHEEKLVTVSESQPSANFSEFGSNSLIKEDKQGDHVEKSETCIVGSEHEGPSSSDMNEVEWLGGVQKETDGKTYYHSCCINGIVYKVKDYALFSSPGNKYLPNKLQAMWEDGKTAKKWVTVTRCFFPDDLPEGVGRPCAPESNEVYESNHESMLAAGLIHGSCEVLSPSKFSEESVVRTRLRARGSDRPKPLFLCKWFYDEKKRLFRDVTC
ncbi:uncharacterized protein LOC112514020 [Cynara cardunculus var. scolymus]|uniref:uncharacterized protein LOC112514020 n=1 Tax=Cynara cardunculus var. scolymus TaxID=59895 RepID=UPI000D62DF41|nr:uncharacterized protein LOC112514020 [Cynara cardunculus var. scolymus]XP_024976072.1 uncharacterized protein LOC112514020 [Cynara cardunculus var. scolymus]XP_024976073.1 uncharacterized protein LOC112514020 [Cynara cardunculus var. scolymus]